MKKYLFFILFLVLSIMFIFSCKKKDYTIKQATYFSGSILKGISVSGPWNVKIIQDSVKNYMVIEYSAYVEDYFSVSMDNYNYTYLSLNDFPYNEDNFVLEATIYVTSLEKIDISTASKVTILGSYYSYNTDINISHSSQLTTSKTTIFNVNMCDINISGSSNFNGTIHVQDVLNLDISSASEFTNGISLISNATIFADGASKLNMLNTEINFLNVELTNASKGYVFVSDELTYKLTKASQLFYQGSPNLIEIENSGGSSINPIP